MPWRPVEGTGGHEAIGSLRVATSLGARSGWKTPAESAVTAVGLEVFDNLRRSLAGALVVLLLGGWLWGRGPPGVGPSRRRRAVPASSVDHRVELVGKPEEREWSVHLVLTGKSAIRPLVRALLSLVLLHTIAGLRDAIFRSGVKMLFNPPRPDAVATCRRIGAATRGARPSASSRDVGGATSGNRSCGWLLAAAPATRTSGWPFVIPVLLPGWSPPSSVGDQ